MKTKFILVSVLLFFVTIQLDAQASIGVKLNKTYAGYTDGGPISVTPFAVPLSDYSSKQKGFGISGLFYFDINQFLSFGIEPGVFSRNYYYGQADGLFTFETAIINEETKYIKFEAPIKLRARLPLFNSRIGIYTTLGVNPSKEMMTYEKKTGVREREITKTKTTLLEAWELSRQVGGGIDLNFGNHRVFFDFDFGNLEDDDISAGDWKLEKMQFGVGYLITFNH